MMFRIKICGITTIEDAQAAVEAGADAIGLNFYAPSPRSVVVEKAAKISAEVSGQALVVGVFVNASVEEIAQIASQAKLGAIQLHGDEPPEFLAELAAVVGDLSIVRARRMDERGTQPIAEDLAACQAAGRLPDGLLLDAAVAGEYGGTGKTLAWPELANHESWTRGVPLLLAGGLVPSNVAEAICAVCPAGVDTASGVEISPGVKNHQLTTAFVKAADEAFRG